MALNWRPKKQTPEQQVSSALDANPGHFDMLSERGPSGAIMLDDKVCGKKLILHQPALKSLNAHGACKSHQSKLRDQNGTRPEGQQIPEWRIIEEAAVAAKLQVRHGSRHLMHI